MLTGILYISYRIHLCILGPSNQTMCDVAELLTESFFREDCSFLSSVVAVLCTTFFFLRAVPLPPMRTWA